MARNGELRAKAVSFKAAVLILSLSKDVPLERRSGIAGLVLEMLGKQRYHQWRLLSDTPFDRLRVRHVWKEGKGNRLTAPVRAKVSWMRISSGKYFLIAVLLCWSPFASADAESMHDLHIDFQSGFRGEDVQVLLNGEEFFSRKDLVTNESTALAGSGGGPVEAGTHEVTVIVDGRRKWRKKITINSDIYIGLNISRILGTRFFRSEISDQPILYD